MIFVAAACRDGIQFLPFSVPVKTTAAGAGAPGKAIMMRRHTTAGRCGAGLFRVGRGIHPGPASALPISRERHRLQKLIRPRTSGARSRHARQRQRDRAPRMDARADGRAAVAAIHGIHDGGRGGAAREKPGSIHRGRPGSWINVGPVRSNWIQNDVRLPKSDTGRLRTILVHPTNPDTVYLLTSGGGLWRTNNFLSPRPDWSAKSDYRFGVAGGAVAFGGNRIRCTSAAVIRSTVALAGT